VVKTLGKWGTAAILFCLLCGCSGASREASRAQEASSLKPIAIYYGSFVGRHRGQAPKNEDEFKAYLREKENAESLQAAFHVTDIDNLFVSPRDKKPYVIYYGEIPTSSGPGGAPVIAYEKEGVEGKRFVASAVGAVQEVTEEAFRKMVPNPK